MSQLAEGGATAVATAVATDCVIESQGYARGDANPDNPCQSCQPAQSKSSWSDTPTSRCVTAIAAGVFHSCAIIGGSAYCWGLNDQGQLGTGSTTGSPVPVQVKGLTSGVTAIAAGGAHSCAIVSGRAYCWGSNSGGELGNNSAVYSDVPVKVVVP